MPQDRGRLTKRVAPPGRIGCQLQVVHRTRPIESFFEMMRELRRDLAQGVAVQGLQPLPDARMQPCPAAGRQSPVHDFPVQRMHEFVASTGAAIGELLGAHKAHDLLPARQPVAQIFEVPRVQACRCGADARRKRRAGHARSLERGLLLHA